MLTRDTIQTDEDLLLYVEQCIGRAYNAVGKKRTDRDDVARILREHGAYGSAQHIAVEQYMRRQLGKPEYDREGAQQANQWLDELAEHGITAQLRDRVMKYSPGSRTLQKGDWRELQEAERAYATATRGLDAYEGAVDAAVEAWWRGHASTIQALCYKHADMLLAARRATE